MVLEEIAMGKKRVYGSLRNQLPATGKLESAPTPKLPAAGAPLTSCRRVPDKTRYVTQAFYDRDGLLNLVRRPDDLIGSSRRSSGPQIWPALPPRQICDECAPARSCERRRSNERTGS
jgi:hypothetical protein